MASGEAGRISRDLERLTPAETGLLVRLDSWSDHNPEETGLLEIQDPWRGKTIGETA
jgi:hypothetical protein